MRIQIFIDGGNFHHLALKPLGLQEADFDFDGFASFLADGRQITEIGKRYYIGTVREREGDERSRVAMAKQTRLFNGLKGTGWAIKTSKLRTRTERVRIDARVVDCESLLTLGITEVVYNTFREKGIDVKIATDMAAAAVDDRCEVLIVVSSDTDLVPMIDWVRNRYSKKVEYIGFSILASSGDAMVKPTQQLIARTDRQRVLVESDIRKFVRTEKQVALID
ncbi:NYN domain-containing protein [Candidatus Uhrbacteria bacterium]|nr:NYN domain-containing protein [Candidatus Uhrbacteria bacterium]